jgi:hypothetical protein
MLGSNAKILGDMVVACKYGPAVVINDSAVKSEYAIEQVYSPKLPHLSHSHLFRMYIKLRYRNESAYRVIYALLEVQSLRTDMSDEIWGEHLHANHVIEMRKSRGGRPRTSPKSLR